MPPFVLVGFSREYSQIEFAPQLYKLCTIRSCSGIQDPWLRHFTWEICRPSERWTEAQSAQMSTPRDTDAHEGEEAPQSAHTESGWRAFDLFPPAVNIFCLWSYSSPYLLSEAKLFSLFSSRLVQLCHLEDRTQIQTVLRSLTSVSVRGETYFDVRFCSHRYNDDAVGHASEMSKNVHHVCNMGI